MTTVEPVEQLVLKDRDQGPKPSPQTDLPWIDRIRSRTDGGVTVRVAALSRHEARDTFGVRLGRAGIQPLWVEVVNTEPYRFYIPQILVDHTYFSALEAAHVGHRWFSRQGNARLDRRFREAKLPNFIEAEQTLSGFIFTNLDRGVKYVTMELISEAAQQVRRFDFLAQVPGLEADYQRVRFEQLYTPEERHDLDPGALRTWLEQLPPCTLGPDRKTEGDPLNLVLIGHDPAVFPALARRGWHVTETIRLATVFQTIRASLLGSMYRYAPVSPLYVFGRAQDMALQKSRAKINRRNHLRLWLAPVRASGHPVWVGQISRDIGVRLTTKTLTTHKVDPDMDDTRWYLMQDLFFSQGLKGFTFVRGVGAASPEAPRHNYTGDEYFTDGLRIVAWMSEEPVTYQRVENMGWEWPPGPRRPEGARAGRDPAR